MAPIRRLVANNSSPPPSPEAWGSVALPGIAKCLSHALTVTLSGPLSQNTESPAPPVLSPARASPSFQSVSFTEETYEPRNRIKRAPTQFTLSWERSGTDSDQGNDDEVLPLPQRDALEGKGASEAALEALMQAVGGGCQSGWGRLLH